LKVFCSFLFFPAGEAGGNLKKRIESLILALTIVAIP